MNKTTIIEKVKIALEIREFIQNIFKKHGVQTTYCADAVNPYYNQTDESCDGFICEYYYGHPDKIYTPLGQIQITSSYFVSDENADNAIQEIEDALGLKLMKEPIMTKMGQVGGFYHITKLPSRGLEFKCDCIEKTKNNYIAYDTAKELFQEAQQN